LNAYFFGVHFEFSVYPIYLTGNIVRTRQY